MNENQVVDLLTNLTEKVDMLITGQHRLESDVAQLKKDVEGLQRDTDKIMADNQIIKAYLFKIDDEMNDHHKRLKDLERKMA